MGIHHRGLRAEQWPMPPFAGRGRRAHRRTKGRPTVAQIELDVLYRRAVETQQRANAAPSVWSRPIVGEWDWT